MFNNWGVDDYLFCQDIVIALSHEVTYKSTLPLSTFVGWL